MRLIDLDKICGIDCDNCRNIFFCNFCDAPVVEQSEDCVKRIDAINGIANTHFAISYENYKELINVISNLPPAVPQLKSGKWIDIGATHSQCDKCLAVFEIVSANGEANFCPNCGADMRKSEDKG